MSTPVISVESLGKCYRIRHQQQRPRYMTLRDVLADKTKGVARRLWTAFRRPPTSGLRPPASEDFWALKDVSFEVRQGETLGIIGRNGAGKSTLLKILSRITEPTEGLVRIKGRLASLLEVGTGFHPELTGRENIFLNGAILGMSRAEIRKKFDEIVAFAETEQFLDTPVKRYSSGMYVRLAFAVSAHLEPEILVIDEVLAVGDAQFQKKCLGKMDQVSHEGRTVLFVSHNMGAVQHLCVEALHLNGGKLESKGKTERVVEQYLLSQTSEDMRTLESHADRQGNGRNQITNICIANPAGQRIDHVISGTACSFIFDYVGSDCIKVPRLRFTVYNRSEVPLSHFDTAIVPDRLSVLPPAGQIACNFRKLPLSAGLYSLNVQLMDSDDVLDYVKGAFTFSVGPGDFFGTGRIIEGLGEICLLEHAWQASAVVFAPAKRPQNSVQLTNRRPEPPTKAEL
jgi:lipopolysaccharide transport system ATP-binding protein